MATSRQDRLSGEKKEQTQAPAEQGQEQKTPHELAAEFEQQGNENPPPPPLTDEQFREGMKGMYNFDALENKEMIDLTGEILTRKHFKDGETKPFFFIGWAEVPDKMTGEARKSAKLVGKDRETYYAPSFVIVSAFEKADGNLQASASNPIGCKITSNGMKEGKNNNSWDVKVMVA